MDGQFGIAHQSALQLTEIKFRHQSKLKILKQGDICERKSQHSP
jgi:hypothetical protein